MTLCDIRTLHHYPAGSRQQQADFLAYERSPRINVNLVSSARGTMNAVARHGACRVSARGGGRHGRAEEGRWRAARAMSDGSGIRHTQWARFACRAQSAGRDSIVRSGYPRDVPRRTPSQRHRTEHDLGRLRLHAGGAQCYFKTASAV